MALAAAFCWAGCSPCFTIAGRRIGSLAVNWYRLVLGSLFLSIFCFFWRGSAFPVGASPSAWVNLLVSGFIGFFLCDLCLFRSYLLIGPRLSLLIFSLAPLITAVLSWLWLGETISTLGMIGMVVTLGGVLWVVLEGKPRSDDVLDKKWRFGILLAFLAAIGQALGMIFADLAVVDYDPFASNLIRTYAGIIGFAAVILFSRRVRAVGQSFRDTRAMAWLTAGAVAGPFLGVGLALASLQHIPNATTMTILALLPVLVLPFAKYLLKEEVSPRAAFGAIIAFVGVALFFIPGS